MNALEIHSAIGLYAKQNSSSFKEVLEELKGIQQSLKLIKVRSGLIQSIVLETSNDWSTVSLTPKQFLSIIKGTDKELEKAELLEPSVKIKELTINFVDGSYCTYSSRSISTHFNPPTEISSNIEYLIKYKYDTSF